MGVYSCKTIVQRLSRLKLNIVKIYNHKPLGFVSSVTDDAETQTFV